MHQRTRDHARRRKGRPAWTRVELSDALSCSVRDNLEAMAVAEALERLKSFDALGFHIVHPLLCGPR